MNDPISNSPETDAIDREAAYWVLRIDRRLTAAEQDEYSQWLSADPRHRDAIAVQRWGWEELDRLTGLQTTVNALPDPDLLAPSRKLGARKFLEFAPWLMAVAAAVAVGLFIRSEHPASETTRSPANESVAVPSYALAAPIEQRTLEDGSVIELNRGAAIETHFSAAERRVSLMRGEANFTVAKNPNRPFIVSVGGIEVRAVGTVFNVRLDRAAIEVLVAEGKVQVEQSAANVPTGGQPLIPLMIAGQHAVVALSPEAAPPQVATLSAEEQEQKTAWQPRLLDFTSASLSEIVTDFNRRNPVRLILGDPELGALRLSATFHSDNVEGFVRLMESDFGMRAEWRGETEIVLRKAR